MQREEAFPEYPPGAFASVARFGRRRWGSVPSNGVLELFDGRLTFTNGNGQLTLDATMDDVTEVHVGYGKAAFDFRHDGHRWTVAFVDRGGMGDLQNAPRLPRDITGPHDLPLFRLDDDIDAMRDLCARWVEELSRGRQ